MDAVGSPHTTRKVSVTRDAGSSAGWQHANSSASWSSPATALPSGSAAAHSCTASRSFPATGALAAQVVQRAAPRDRDDPAAGIGRQAITRPLLHGRRARLLRAVLCQRQVTREPGHRRRRGPPRGAQRPLDVPAQCGPITITGRTSTDPYLADGIIAAYRSAVSRSSQSRM